YTLAIAGCPPLAGFWSKDAILGSAIALDDKYLSWHHFGQIIAILLLGVAAMTSFYMFRLYFLVFSGKPRDEHAFEHAHESPPVMTVPLTILAFLSAIGGFIGTPFHDWFGELLGAAPEVHVPWANMALGTLAFGGGLVLAYTFYYGGVRQPARRLVAAVP